MKVLLSTPPVHYLQGYSFKYPRFPWLSLPVLAGAVRGKHRVRIVSHTHFRDRPHNLAAVIASFRPDVLAFAVPAPLSSVALSENLPALRKRFPNLKILCGGQYPTFEPRRLLDAGCDAVCLGEADRTFPAILDAISGGDLRHAPGVAYLDRGEMTVNANEDYPEDLDDLPLPAFDLWPPTHRTVYKRGAGGTMEISRGCPHQCTYCVLPAFHRKYREKSNDRVLEELRLLVSSGVREILLADGIIAVRREKTVDLMERIVAAGLGLEFIMFLRADTAARNPDLIALMRRAGLRMAIVGFESYSDEGLESMKKSATAQTNRDALRVLQKNGVYVSGSHLYGVPPESYREAIDTFRQGAALCDDYMAGIFTPIPGSPLYDDLRKRGLLLTDDPGLMDYTRVLIAGGPSSFGFRLLTGAMHLIYQMSPRRIADALWGAHFNRAVARSEFRLLFWRIVYAAARKIGLRIV